MTTYRFAAFLPRLGETTPVDNITGCLLFSGRYFAQVLEGRPEVTSRKLDTITSDPRHVDFRLLVERHVVERTYAEWSMGYLHDLGLEDQLEALARPTSRHPQTSLSMSWSGCSRIR